jgi:hypothetical protein
MNLFFALSKNDSKDFVEKKLLFAQEKKLLFAQEIFYASQVFSLLVRVEVV